MEKKCTVCGQAKELSEFYVRNRSKDGLESYCKGCDKARVKNWQSNNSDWVREKDRKYKKKYPEKVKAAEMANYAIKTGRLKKQPCEVCGEKNVHAHHDDYSEPLEVRWLCPQCHVDHHEWMKALDETWAEQLAVPALQAAKEEDK